MQRHRGRETEGGETLGLRDIRLVRHLAGETKGGETLGSRDTGL